MLAAIAGGLVWLTGCNANRGESPVAQAAANPAAARFVDVADAAGLRYVWHIEGKRPLSILQTIGNGCAFLDYNNDGALDVLLVGPKLALFRGDGKGHFTDVTTQVGLDKLKGHFLGCAVGDYDNDGFDDIYVSGYGTGLLLHNESGKGFRDVTAQAGIKPQPWGTSCAFAETVPGSGRLDLYVANYADFGPKTDPQLCLEKGVMTSCGPRNYKPLPGVLYQNDGKGHFTDATKASGLTTMGRGLGVGFADFDGSGHPGIYIANDEIAGDLLRPTVSQGKRVYKNVAELAGAAYDRDGNVHGGMGMDWGDFDNDGKFDLFVATYQNESKSLYHNDGEGRFSDMGIPTGIGSPTTPFVAFGCKFLDFDNDGWLDLAIANGHVQDNVEKIYPASTYRQAAQLFHNKGGSPIQFDDVSQSSGPDLMRTIIGRGLAVGDFDNDGREDILLVDSEGKPLLLHNQERASGHWVGIKLVGAKSNRSGYGAILTAQVGARTLTRQCQSCGSYMSASDARVHFGLGAATTIDILTVKWPSGRTDTYKNLAADRYLTLREGNPTPL